MNKPVLFAPDPAQAPAPDSLVQDGRVHSAVFTDTRIFDLEIERIFHRTWLYIGHASEVPDAGDFRVRRMGRQSVIMMRGTDGAVRVLMNRCRHRGSVLTEQESGNTRYLRCWYHGWTYDTTGRLASVPQPEGYTFDHATMGLTPAPRTGEYRGFVFASLSSAGQSLPEHLGLAAAKIDMMIDASPAGELQVRSGAHKTTYRGNWKLVGMDGYHVHFVHAAVVAAWNRNLDAGIASTHAGDPFSDDSDSRARDLGNGHAMLDLSGHRLNHYDGYVEKLRAIEGGPEYLAAMYARHPAEQAKFLIALAGDPHVGIFPNLQLINNQIRIITPLGPGDTEVVMFPVSLGGVSDAMNTARLRAHESFYGPAGGGSPDDAEIFERVQNGLQSQVNPWIDLSRGMHRETREADGSIAGRISDETTQRSQMKRWRELMNTEG
jgi:phenylpropionate dioxygenase-like ring-hydroxylating dioxygenase large terminal subunit